jgi:addiction module RelE/StbE family toxin
MGFQIVFTKPAIADLKALVGFIARDNPPAAERFGFEIIDRAERLIAFPFVGRVVPEFKTESLREVIHRPYRIIYRVHEDKKLIEVLRVWHAARGIPKI